MNEQRLGRVLAELKSLQEFKDLLPKHFQTATFLFPVKTIEQLETDLWDAADNLRANSKLTAHRVTFYGHEY